MNSKPKISIVIPIYNMPRAKFFLDRCIDSIHNQTFDNYEIVITKEGKMAENTNAGIKKSKGELIKILFMDDYLTHKNALQVIVDSFHGQWLVTGCKHDPGDSPHWPRWDDKMVEGVNTIGSPSVMTIKNEEPLLFDENLGWLLDCDYYQRMYDKYGEPVFLNDINVTIGIGEHQATNLMGDKVKTKEQQYLYEKYSSVETNN